MIASPQSAGPQTCAYHQDRGAHARCVSCRKPLCRGCATPWEGIFLCAACLSERRATVERKGSFWGWGKLGVGLIAAAGLAVLLLAWVLGLWAELLSGSGS